MVIKSRETWFAVIYDSAKIKIHPYLSDIIVVMSNNTHDYRVRRKVEAFKSLLCDFKSRW